MSTPTRQARYEELSEEQLAIAETLANEDAELGPVFAAMLEDLQGGDHS
jgi:hypothetical protein